MSPSNSSLIKYLIGVALISAVIIMLMPKRPETNDLTVIIMDMAERGLILLIAGIGFYFARKSAKEFARKEYENKPFEFESLELWKPYTVLAMARLKSYTLFNLGPVHKKPEDIDFTEKVIYIRVWNEHLPKNIEQGSIICREKYDKICIHKENTQEN
ncbi:MAG: hypothetical protein NTU58_01440 [Candidatus Nealsonbacteria bacterium]|nr:hypothetical protein [Candidatus Nealsonbacteria bacterium]